MGLLSLGSPLPWPDTKKHADLVRQTGIKQFLAIYQRLRERKDDCLKWGDEIEFTVVHLDHEQKTAQLQLTPPSLLATLQEEENAHPGETETAWRPEYGSYMLEATPGRPFGGTLCDFNKVEANMKLRREEINALLGSDQYCLTITSFPRLGCEGFTNPRYTPKPETSASHSLFFPDEAINGHPRFSTLTRNIRERRGSKVAMNIPIFKDSNTPSPFVEDLADEESRQAAKPDHIYMDAMGFGMGMSCVQVTFQACSIEEARVLYDQLTVVCPIVLALSASTPIFRGYLSDRDCRWDVICGAVDDRTAEEKGEKPLKTDRFYIPKSRYGSVSCYLASGTYNDNNVVQDPDIYQSLRAAGIDHLLSQHMAHLFIRDPLTLWSEQIHQNIEDDSNHFENIQSTNWQSMRFKPPPPQSPIGWRVEFRPTDLQPTDFQNAALVVFVVLLTRAILSLNLNFYLPISKVDENMKRAQERNAVCEQKFYFRKNVHCEQGQTAVTTADSVQPSEDEFAEMDINTIINGKEGVFPGLVPLMEEYLTGVQVDVDTRCTVSRYLKLIQKRASGDLLTPAAWIRQFVTSHPDYNRDSVISDSINYDLLCKINRFGLLKEPCPEMEGSL